MPPLSEGEVVLAERYYQMANLDDEWLEESHLKKSRYRLRTGVAASAPPSSPWITEPVYVFRRTVTQTLTGTLQDEGEIIPVDISSGDVIRSVDPDDFPADFAPFAGDTEEGGYYWQYVTEQVLYKWLQVDTNMDGVLSLETGTASASPAPTDDGYRTNPDGSKTRLMESDGGLILDINNNNSDSETAGSPTQGDHDHLSPDLDGAGDIEEITSTTSAAAPGHLSGHSRISLPRDFVLKSLRGGTVPGASQYVSIYRTGDPCVRVHLKDGGANALGVYKKRILGVPGDMVAPNQPDERTEEELPPALWAPRGGQLNNPHRDLNMLLEGVSAGVCDLVVEIRQYDALAPNGYTVRGTSKARIQVNVDQLPEPDAGKPRARGLAGVNPHFAGFDFGDILPSGTAQGAGIIALRGRLRAEFPAHKYSDGWKPMLTHRHGLLRLKDQAEDEEATATASFWFGINSRALSITNEQGLENVSSASCWIQAGLILTQEHNQPRPSMAAPAGVRMFLESGRIGYKNPVQQTFASEATYGSSNVVPTPILRAWQTKGIAFDFVLFQNRDPSTTSRDPWFLVVHDVRTADSLDYVRLKANPPDPNGETPDI